MTVGRARARRFAHASLLAASVAAASAAELAQEKVAPAAADLRAEAWLTAARAHVAGRFDVAATTVAGWPPDVTSVAVDRAVRGSADWSVIARGLVLHTDIAVEERTSTAKGPAKGAIGWTILDGKPAGPMRRSFHWDVARRLAAILAAPLPGERTARVEAVRIARAWYRAAAALQQQWADLGPVRTHLRHGVAIFPDDAALAVYQGTLHQGFADPRVQSYVSQHRAPQRGPNDRFVRAVAIADASAELGRAELALRRALAIDPTLLEARIRLAHVVGERGKPEDAVRLAREALAGPLPPFLDFYAAMVLGRNALKLGHAAEARTAFERAAARYPAAQSAQVALTHVHLVGGRTAEGVDTAVRALGSGSRDDDSDPWSWYFLLHEPDARSLMDELRSLTR